MKSIGKLKLARSFLGVITSKVYFKLIKDSHEFKVLYNVCYYF